MITFSFRKTALENLFTQEKGVAVRSFTFLLVDSLPSQAQDWSFSNHVIYTEGKSVLIKSKKSNCSLETVDELEKKSNVSLKRHVTSNHCHTPLQYLKQTRQNDHETLKMKQSMP